MEQSIKQGTRKEITLAEPLDLTGTKPVSMLFNGKEFRYTKRDGWKALYEDLATELYKIAPQTMQKLAARQMEFFISDEPALWSTENRLPAQNYEDEWWSEIGKNVFIYTKNNTNAKLERMRGLLEACKQNPAETIIILY